jgi:hypothetical protein
MSDARAEVTLDVIRSVMALAERDVADGTITVAGRLCPRIRFALVEMGSDAMNDDDDDTLTDIEVFEKAERELATKERPARTLWPVPGMRSTRACGGNPGGTLAPVRRERSG